MKSIVEPGPDFNPYQVIRSLLLVASQLAQDYDREPGHRNRLARLDKISAEVLLMSRRHDAYYRPRPK